MAEEQERTFVCVTCADEVTVPSADRIGSIELVLSHGWDVRAEGAYCREHKPNSAVDI
jgi:hypothetical protein